VVRRLSCRVGICKLPKDILANIMEYLDIYSLSAARLVCKAFRAASVPCIKSLSLKLFGPCCKCLENKLRQYPLPQRLQAFPCVTALDLVIRLPINGEVLECSAALPLIRSLYVLLIDDCLATYAPRLEEATGLTSLELHICKAGSQVADALRACSNLQVLELGLRFEDPAALQQLAKEVAPATSNLRKLSIGDEEQREAMAPFWKTLMRESPDMSRLQILDGLVLDEWEHDAAHVAAFSQLICLRAACPRGVWWTSEVTQLSRLTDLLVLGLDGQPICTSELYSEITATMTKLMRLELSCWDADVKEMDSLLASLPAITALTLGHPANSYNFPDAFLSNGFAGLRHLDITLYGGEQIACDIDGMLRLSSALTGLHKLVVASDNRSCQKLLAYLPRMPDLTSLLVSSDIRRSTRKLSRPTARFLEKLPSLRSLNLQNVLDVKRWDEDVKYVAALTNLRFLSLQGGQTEAEAAMERLTEEQVRPLMALWRLNSVLTTDPWNMSHCKELHQTLKSLRDLWGRPETQFTALGLIRHRS
jgi:hypothetical protein